MTAMDRGGPAPEQLVEVLDALLDHGVGLTGTVSYGRTWYSSSCSRSVQMAHG